MKNLFAALLFLSCFGLYGQNWEWAYGFGATELERSWDMCISPHNDIIITGRYSDSMHIGTCELPFSGQADFFIASFSENGSVNWARNISGKGEEIGIGVDCDSEGNLYAIGYFSDSLQIEDTVYIAQSWEVFVVSYTPEGELRWFYHPHSDGYEVGYGISVSGADKIYAVGWFQNYLAVNESDTLHCYGSSDPFLIKLNTEGAVENAFNFGGESVDYAFKVAADDADNVYITGVGGGNWHFGAEQFFMIPGMYVAKVLSDGTPHYVLSGENASVNQIGCDDYGNAYACGRITDTARFGDFFLATFDGSDDGYLAKSTFDGNWQWVSALASNGNVRSRDVAVHNEPGQNLATANSFTDSLQLAGETFFAAAEDILITEFNSEGQVLWALQAGGGEVDIASSIAYDRSDNLIVSGWYSGDADFGSYHLTGGNQYDMNFFIAKISSLQSADKKLDMGSMLKTSPNPASTILKAEAGFGISSCRIMDMQGKTMIALKPSSCPFKVHIDVSALPSGNYLLEIKGNRGQTEVKTVIVQ